MARQPPAPLVGRLQEIGRKIGAREAAHRDALDAAREVADRLRARVAEAIEGFHAAARDAGAPHLRIDVGEPCLDHKHARAVQFELRRGRYQALVTVKSRGDVTMVGPFRQGKVEGPCRKFPFGADAEIDAALGDFLERFLEEASAP
jgi:hypothetical protein